MKVSIIIVNWNGLRWLRDCFGSLMKQNYRNFEIIFVDNRSSDKSVEWVKKHYPRTVIIVNNKNVGFAEANDIGLRKAKGDYVLFLNNDTKVTKTFLSELVCTLEQDELIAGAQSKILLMDKPDTHDSVGAYLTPTGVLYHFGFGKNDTEEYNQQFDLYTAKGACMMFKKSVLHAVSVRGNIFDPDYFSYFEETDLCHRIWLAGYRVVYAYKSVIFHQMGATSSNMDAGFIQFHSFKNRIRTYLKNFGTVWLFVFVPPHIIFCLLYVFINICKGNFEIAVAIVRALWWNICNIKATLRYRAIIQNKIRKVDDSELGSHILKLPSIWYYLTLLRGNWNK